MQMKSYKELAKKPAAYQLVDLSHSNRRVVEVKSEHKEPWLPDILHPDTSKLLEEYQEQFNKPYPKDGLLTFPSEQIAHDFFQKQAEVGLKFIILLVDENMNMIESGTLFSCGDGALYKGTFSEIHAQLEKAIQQNKGNTKAIEGLARIKEWMPPNSAFQMEAREQMKAPREKYKPAVAPTNASEPKMN